MIRTNPREADRQDEIRIPRKVALLLASPDARDWNVGRAFVALLVNNGGIAGSLDEFSRKTGISRRRARSVVEDLATADIADAYQIGLRVHIRLYTSDLIVNL